MPRRKRAQKRVYEPDLMYNSSVVTRFVNNIMRSGKKTVAEGIFYGAMDIIKERTKEEPMETFKKAMDNVGPLVMVKSRRIGGATYQVPLELSAEKREDTAIKWLILYSKKKKGKPMAQRLAEEMLDAAKGEGAAFKKREDTHRMADANKAFAHFKY
ncbi:MAG: 30S ribosomal protein S7 [Candidatus Muiribacteriota bacterium]|jgi:small subunit ribosomal protein S7